MGLQIAAHRDDIGGGPVFVDHAVLASTALGPTCLRGVVE
jgi:hypothetical protein